MMGAKWNIIVTVFHNFFSMNIKPVLRVKNKFCSYHADEYGRTVEMIISSSFFFYHVNFIIDQLSVMQNNFKYGVSCIGIINKYAL